MKKLLLVTGFLLAGNLVITKEKPKSCIRKKGTHCALSKIRKDYCNCYIGDYEDGLPDSVKDKTYDLSNANFSGATFSSNVFINTSDKNNKHIPSLINLSNSNFSNCTFSEYTFKGNINLSSANFSNSRFSTHTFSTLSDSSHNQNYINLLNANFSHADFNNATVFEGNINLSNANFTDSKNNSRAKNEISREEENA